MALHASATELRKMQIPELRKEIERRRLELAKDRLGISMRSLKDTARYRRAKRDLARMCTVLTQLEAGSQSGLKTSASPTTVPAPARRTA